MIDKHPACLRAQTVIQEIACWMPVMARCPCYAWSEKNINIFFVKNLRDFLDPPVRSSGAPWKGGLCPDPRDPPLPGGPPEKRGRPSPGEKTRKNAKKGGPICEKWGFWGQKWPFSGEICTFLTIFQKWPGSYAGKKRAFKPACPLGKNPPIYTVLNAAFSAPHPPLGGTSAQSAPPEGPGGPPP